MKILLAIEDSKFSEAATQTVASQIVPQGTEVVVLQVVDPLIFSVPPMMAPDYAPEMAGRLKDYREHAEKTVAQAAAMLKVKGFKVEGRVVEGEVRTAILSVAEEQKSDLIVLGSHGRTGIKKFLLGSIAESVARHARCSVLIVRALGQS